jgi:YcaO-like protein with predicted kinase domain
MGSADILRRKLDEASKRRTPKLTSGRGCSFEETLERIRPLMPIAGITRVADVTGLDKIGLPVVMVVRPNARSLTVAQGKGLSLTAAKVSGIMESLECFHAERLAGPVQMGRHADLTATHDVVDPYTLPLLPTSHFRSEITIPWVEALDLDSGRVKLVPFEIASADFTFPGVPGTGFFGRSTNGLASGNSIHEAMLSGFCEVIERDAWALWHASRGATGVAIDPALKADSRLVALLSQIHLAGCTITVEEITTDLKVPVFFARLTGGGHGSPATELPAGGLGCHPERNIALLRAICEAAQSRLTRIAGSRDDIQPRWYSDPEGTREQLHGPKIVESSEGVTNDTIEEDYAWVQERLAACGMAERLVIDLSNCELKLPVLKVVVPGLETLPEIGCPPGPRAKQHFRRQNSGT